MTLSGGASADDVARWVVAEGVATAAAAGCAVRRAGAWRAEVGGDAGVYFDLASITKPFTALAIVRAGIELSTPLGMLVEEARGTASDDVPLGAFLAHRAGLCAHLPLYAPLVTGGAVDAGAALRTIAAARREEARGALPQGGFPPLYSDLGYVLAGVALARHVGARDAAEAIAARVVGPLGLAGAIGSARELAALGVDLAERAAPTEDVPWRGGVVRGQVHDENAWALTGLGGSGHAGLFGTVASVMAFGCAVLDALRKDRGIDALVAARPGGTLRAGFDGKSPDAPGAPPSTAGRIAGLRTFGHLGFTGTSLWIDPDAAAVTVLLTNRVHPTRANAGIRAARPVAHDALFTRARRLAGELGVARAT